MTVMTISTLAEREARAEAGKSKADATWRTAWWATTLHLGSLSESRTGPLPEAQAIVREATGQSAGWVGERTRAGKKIIQSGLGSTLNDLPPKMVTAAIRAGIEITPAVVKAIRKAEKDGVPMRDLIESLTGKAWADRPGGLSETAITEIVKAQPKAVAKAIVEQAPSVAAEALAKTGSGRATARDAIEAVENPRLAKQRKTTAQSKAELESDKTSGSDRGYLTIEVRLDRANGALRDALHYAQNANLNDEAVELLTDSLDKTQRLVELLRMKIAGDSGVDWDREVARILEAGIS